MIASKNALKINNQYPPTYVHLANCLVAVGKTQEAIEALEMSLKLDNTNFEAYYGLAQLKYLFSDFDLSYLKDALINDNISLESRAFSAMALWCYYDNIKEYEIFDSMGKKVAIIESRKTDVTDFENGIFFIKLNIHTRTSNNIE